MCYIMLSAVVYQNMLLCHFCIFLCDFLLSMKSTRVMSYNMSSLLWCNPLFMICHVLIVSSLQNSLYDIDDFRDLEFHRHFPVVIFMPCIHVATECSMPLLSMFSKDDFEILLCSIHPCLCLQLWSVLA